jgi:hypothetical protein
MTYNDWTIEIKMGHEFKGTRGSVRRMRGYIATNKFNGKVQEFRPQSGCLQSLTLIKKTLDLLNETRAPYPGELTTFGPGEGMNS